MGVIKISFFLSSLTWKASIMILALKRRQLAPDPNQEALSPEPAKGRCPWNPEVVSPV